MTPTWCPLDAEAFRAEARSSEQHDSALGDPSVEIAADVDVNAPPSQPGGPVVFDEWIDAAFRAPSLPIILGLDVSALASPRLLDRCPDSSPAPFDG